MRRPNEEEPITVGADETATDDAPRSSPHHITGQRRAFFDDADACAAATGPVPWRGTSLRPHCTGRASPGLERTPLLAENAAVEDS
jgi:hypothetical protein